MAEKKDSIFSEVKDYVQTELDLLKINLLEKTARILAIVIGFVIAAVFSLVAIAYFSLMFYDMFVVLFDSRLWATLIMVAIFLVLSVLMVIFAERLFRNFFIKKIYAVMFLKEDEEPAVEESSQAEPIEHIQETETVNTETKEAL